MNRPYVHGYDERESIRLQDQARSVVDLFHSDTRYPEGSSVLEAGCGTGAQTVTLARNSPGARFISIDHSQKSLAEAAARLKGIGNVKLERQDIFALPYPPASFDHVFVCFVLEHVARPVEALHALKKVLKPGGTITVLEGDHGSTYFHPDNQLAHRAIRCLVDLQRQGGGNANIGRQLYPLLQQQAGFREVRVSPRMVYVDASKPHLVESFTRNTFAAMIEGVREPAIAAGMMSAAAFDEGIRALYRSAEDDGVFCYTFFKAVGVRATNS